MDPLLKKGVKKSGELFLVWMIWKERNQRSFEYEVESVLILKSIFFSNFHLWVKWYRGCWLVKFSLRVSIVFSIPVSFVLVSFLVIFGAHCILILYLGTCLLNFIIAYQKHDLWVNNYAFSVFVLLKQFLILCFLLQGTN